MCGIAGVVLPGPDAHAAPIIAKLLEDMQYRGYDSWGMATLAESGDVRITKRVGPPDEGFKELEISLYTGNVAIGHNRWATQGEVSEKNAHPHSGCDPYEFLGVHNGVIENYDFLLRELKQKGHTINTDVDSELILHLIEDERENGNGKNFSFAQSVALAFRRVVGAFGFAGMSAHDPNTLVVARRSSPVCIGFLKNGGYVVASDKGALLPHTDQYTDVGDNEVVVLRPYSNPFAFDLALNILPPKKRVKIEGSAEQNSKEGFPHFMLKELFESADAVRKVTQGRTLPTIGSARLGGINQENIDALCHAQRIMIIASGTSEHAGLVGKQYLQTLARIPTEVIDASEFLYGDVPLSTTCEACRGTGVIEIKAKEESLTTLCRGCNGAGVIKSIVIVVSQSGETADVLNALLLAKRQGILTLAIVNKVGSAIAQAVGIGHGVYLHVGPEIAVASTKAFTGQISAFLLLALLLGRARGFVSEQDGKVILAALHEIPSQIRFITECCEEIKILAGKYTAGYGDFLFFGRNVSATVAYEAALKLMEISYINSPGIAAGKMKHGFLAVIAEIEKGGYPSCFIAPHGGDPEKDELFLKTLTNIKEVRARHGTVLAIATSGNMMIRPWVDDVFYIPKTHRLLTPLLSTVVLQFFAYYAAVARGLNPDQPRNLAKSVTVE